MIFFDRFSPKDKINILFDAFDFDESGSLDPREVTKMIEMISNTTFQDAQQMAQQIFQWLMKIDLVILILTNYLEE